MTPSVAFVTPSYRRDRNRCALLGRSLEVCAPSVEHWIVVDRGDVPFFRPLQNGRTTVVAKEDLLPLWVRRLDTLKVGLRSNAWVQARGFPIRGWLLQQLVKLAVAEQLSADLLVYADSDVVLLRPFSVSSLVDGDGRVRLYAREDYIDAALPDHVRWHRSAEKLLGIEPAGLPMPDFISSLVPWKRENAVALLEHIERTTGKHWLPALASAWHVSEYTLYGRFAQDVLGTSGGQFVSSTPLCSDYYKRVPLTVPELKTLLDRVGPDEIAVSITSKAGMDPEQYVDVLERRWADLGQREPAADAQPGYGRSGSGRARVGEGAAGRPVRRPIRQRTRARPARVRRQGSATPRGQVLYHTARHRVTWAMLIVLALMVVLVDLGMD